MLHLCQDDEVARRNIGAAPTIGNQVDTLGGIACEDNLFTLASIDKAGHFYTRLFHGRRRLFADLVDSAMNVGVICLVIYVHRIDDSTRLL